MQVELSWHFVRIEKDRNRRKQQLDNFTKSEAKKKKELKRRTVYSSRIDRKLRCKIIMTKASVTNVKHYNSKH